MASRQNSNHLKNPLIGLLLLLILMNLIGCLKDVCWAADSNTCDIDIVPSSEKLREDLTLDNSDENGYLLFCLCMGRFGNKIEHLLGALSFAKSINRIAVIPPFPNNYNIKFTNYFKLEPIINYQSVITMEQFMSEVAPIKWTPDKRLGYCWGKTTCDMKPGNPHRSFWDGFNIDFIKIINYTLSYNPNEHTAQSWRQTFPPDKHPVIALKGAPAPYPMRSTDYHLQKLLVWSDEIQEHAREFIKSNINGPKFIGIHLRNGKDWLRPCQKAEGQTNFMASPQCMGQSSSGVITMEICLPNITEIGRVLKKIILETGITNVFIATDKNPMIEEIQDNLNSLKNINLFHRVGESLQVDLAILGECDYFIGNCVSSVTSFVTRTRLVENKPFTFWGLG